MKRPLLMASAATSSVGEYQSQQLLNTNAITGNVPHAGQVSQQAPSHHNHHHHHKHAGTTLRLSQLAAGVLVFHLLNSILQEAVFHLEGFHHAIALSFMQTVLIAAFALFDFIRTKETRKAPLRTYFFLSVLSTTSVILTNEASRLLNYPTQVIFKSSKLLFVMTVRYLMMPMKSAGKHKHSHANRRSRHRREEIIACLMIVGGLVAFTWATSANKVKGGSSDKEFSAAVRGVVAICIALICDALLYVGEEKYCFDQCQSSNTEVILFCYAFATLNSGASLVLSGQLEDSVAFAFKQPSFVGFVVMFSLCNFCGTNFLLKVVSEFNSNSAVIVTSVRKIATVLFSFIIYPKPFGGLHLMGLACVSGGIYLHESSRVAAKKEEAIHLVVQEEEGIV